MDVEPSNQSRRVFYLAIVTSIFHLYFNLVATWPDNYIAAMHFMLFGSLVILTEPLQWRKAPSLSRSLDLVLMVALLASSGYLIAFSDDLAARNYEFSSSDWWAASTAVVLALELVRPQYGLVYSHADLGGNELCAVFRAIYRRGVSFRWTQR